VEVNTSEVKALVTEGNQPKSLIEAPMVESPVKSPAEPPAPEAPAPQATPEVSPEAPIPAVRIVENTVAREAIEGPTTDSITVVKNPIEITTINPEKKPAVEVIVPLTAVESLEAA
jgi:hypothetical protein